MIHTIIHIKQTPNQKTPRPTYTHNNTHKTYTTQQAQTHIIT